jgi:hypothetical protein
LDVIVLLRVAGVSRNLPSMYLSHQKLIFHTGSGGRGRGRGRVGGASPEEARTPRGHGEAEGRYCLLQVPLRVR